MDLLSIGCVRLGLAEYGYGRIFKQERWQQPEATKPIRSGAGVAAQGPAAARVGRSDASERRPPTERTGMTTINETNEEKQCPKTLDMVPPLIWPDASWHEIFRLPRLQRTTNAFCLRMGHISGLPACDSLSHGP